MNQDYIFINYDIMDSKTMRAVSRRTVLINHNLNDTKEWDEFLNISFNVDEIIVRSVSYIQDAAQVATMPQFITCNLLSTDDCLCVITDSTSTNNPQSIFNLNQRQVNGNVHFRVNTYTGALSGGTGRLMILLEFVKYA